MNVLHPSEAIRLVAAVDPHDPFGPRDHALLVFALHTGCRVSELAALTVGMVAVDGAPRQTLFLPASMTKGARSRAIPLNQAARQAVAQLIDFNRRRGFPTGLSAPLFCNRMHQPMTVRAIQRMVQATREKARLDVPATPHSLRHSCASSILSCTGNLRVVQQILGHRRLNTVEIYSHPTREDLRQAVELTAEKGVLPCA